MTKSRATPARPQAQYRGRDEWEYVRAGRDGSYWQGADGLTVRVATAERDGEAQRVQVAPQPARPAGTMKAEKKEPTRIARAAWNLVFGR